MKMHNQHIQLIPVIELSPFDFQNNNYETPNLSLKESPDAWENFNQKCYFDSGLLNPTPIYTGSWLFDLEQFDKQQLTIILKAIFKNEEEKELLEIFKEPIEFAPFFCGGYLFTVDNRILAEPGCCCGLESIMDWKAVLKSKSGQVWTGHDVNSYVNFNIKKGKVQFEVNQETYIIQLDEYSLLIKNTESILQQLISKSGNILNDLFDIQNGMEVSRGMIYK